MKKVLTLLLVFVLAMSLVACTAPTDESSTAGQTEKVTATESAPANSPSNTEEVSEGDSTYTIGVCISALTNPFFVYMAESIQAYADKAGIECIILDSKEDPAVELANIEDLISRQVDGIVLNAVDSDASVSGVKEAIAAGISVSSVDRVINSEGLVAQFVSDNEFGGELAGQYARELLTKRYGEVKGKIVIMRGYSGITTDNDRYGGFVSQLQDEINSGAVEIVGEQFASWDRTQAFNAMEDIIQAQDEIDLVYGMNDEMALGCVQALEAANRLEGVDVIGFDGAEAGIDAVKTGKMKGTVAQKFGKMGCDAFQALIDYFNGNLTETDVLNRVEVFMVTVDDVSSYEMQ